MNYTNSWIQYMDHNLWSIKHDLLKMSGYARNGEKSFTEFNYGEKCYWESFQYKVRQFVGCLWRIEWGILIIDIENFTHGANSIVSFTMNPRKTGCMPFFYRFGIKSNRKIKWSAYSRWSSSSTIEWNNHREDAPHCKWKSNN